jgi:hypothetical protein
VLLSSSPEILEFYIRKGVITPQKVQEIYVGNKREIKKLAKRLMDYQEKTKNLYPMVIILFRLGIYLQYLGIVENYEPEILKFYIDKDLITKKEIEDTDLIGYYTGFDNTEFLKILVAAGMYTKKEIADMGMGLSYEVYMYLKDNISMANDMSATLLTIITNCELKFMDQLIRDGLKIGDIEYDELFGGIYDLLKDEESNPDCIESMLNKLIYIGLTREKLDEIVDGIKETKWQVVTIKTESGFRVVVREKVQPTREIVFGRDSDEEIDEGEGGDIVFGGGISDLEEDVEIGDEDEEIDEEGWIHRRR